MSDPIQFFFPLAWQPASDPAQVGAGTSYPFGTTLANVVKMYAAYKQIELTAESATAGSVQLMTSSQAKIGQKNLHGLPEFYVDPPTTARGRFYMTEVDTGNRVVTAGSDPGDGTVAGTRSVSCRTTYARPNGTLHQEICDYSILLQVHLGAGASQGPPGSDYSTSTATARSQHTVQQSSDGSGTDVQDYTQTLSDEYTDAMLVEDTLATLPPSTTPAPGSTSVAAYHWDYSNSGGTFYFTRSTYYFTGDCDGVVNWDVILRTASGDLLATTSYSAVLSGGQTDVQTLELNTEGYASVANVSIDCSCTDHRMISTHQTPTSPQPSVPQGYAVAGATVASGISLFDEQVSPAIKKLAGLFYPRLSLSSCGLDSQGTGTANGGASVHLDGTVIGSFPLYGASGTATLNFKTPWYH